MNSPTTYGERFSASVGEYLKANNLTSLGKISGRILGELAQRFHDNERKVKKQKVRLASEEEWLKEIESEPAMKGIDVRQELGRCQFYCKNNNRICTRKTFTNWLLNPLTQKAVLASYDGATSRPKPAYVKPHYDVTTIVPCWAMLLRTVPEMNFTNEEIEAYCALEWEELPVPVRDKIVRVA